MEDGAPPRGGVVVPPWIIDAMRMLLLGAGGRVGMHLMHAAARAAQRVHVISIDHRDLDLTDAGAIERLLEGHSFDLLVNCAGYCPGPGVSVEAARAFEVNAYPAGVLAAACRRRRAGMVQLSCYEVFDGHAGRAYTELDAPAPVTIPGAAWAMAERLALNEHPQALVLRLGRLFGGGGAGEDRARAGGAGAAVEGETVADGMIRQWLEEARHRRELTVPDNERYSLLYLPDAAMLILGLLQMRPAPGIYHLANAGTTSAPELARRLVATARLQARVVTANSHPRWRDHTLDLQRLSALLGRLPHWSDALDRHLRHHRLV